MRIKIIFLVLVMAAVWSVALAATDDFSKVAKATQVFQADDFLGAGNTAISIGVPPGRKNMQPEISVSYSSAAPNGWLGLGWTLNLGYIERSTKNGIPKYTSSDTFYLSFQGLNTDLVGVSYYNTDEYYPKTSPVIIKFIFNGTYWTAYDKEGRTYIFGETSNSRIGLPQGTYRWALNKVVDSCGNYMIITYTQESYQIYPLRIEYTGNEAASVLPTHSVEFILENRQDVISSYRSGTHIITNKRLREIKTYVSSSLASRYLFEYVYSGQTNRSLLNKFTRFGNDGVTSLPSPVFTYNNSPPGSYRFINAVDNLNNKLWNIRRNFGPLWNTPPAEDVLTPKGTTLSGATMLMWDHVKTEQIGSFWAVDSKAKLSVNLPDAGAFHAWTYVYVSAVKTISISATGSDRFFFWLNGDYTAAVNPQSLNLKEGSNLIEITGYNKTGLCTFNLNYALSDNVTRVNSFQYAIPQFVGDFNGDGMSDLGAYYGSIGSIRISLSQGETFGPNDIWPVLPYTVFPGMLPQVTNMILGDFNGDTLTDIMGLNAATEYELASASTNKNFSGGGISTKIFNLQGKPFAADFNNDGKTDVGLQVDGTNDILIALKGATSSFNAATYWLYNFPGKILIGDFNGDGLIDIGSLNTSQTRVNIALSKGDGFLASASWLSSITVSEASTADLNNDGLIDLIYYDKVNGRIMAAFSDGSKFLSPVVYLSGFTLKNVDVFIQSGDFNGDCAIDFYVYDPVTLKSDLAYSKPYFVDMLNKAENGKGGVTSIEYGISGNYLNAGLPFSLPVVNKVTISDGMGNSFATTYSFKDGLYDKIDREFRGFGTVGTVDPDGNRRIVYLKQDSTYKGRVYREEYKDAADSLYLKIENTWASQLMKDWSMGAGKLVILSRQDKYTYDGDATYKTSYAINEFSPAYGATSGTYSNQVGGDVTMITEGGTSTVQKYNYMKYVWTNGSVILTRPSFVASLATDTALTLNKKQLYYDNNTAIDAKPTKGLLTKEKVFTITKNIAMNPETIDTYALITNYGYDTFGNLISKTDPESRTTMITYDTIYRMFPIQENNAAGLIIKRTYDAKTGEVLTYTDENNQLTTYVYDTFGRLIKVIGPNDTAQYPGTTYEYDMSACPNKVIKRQKTVSPSTYATEISFYDGLGRLIETKVDAEPDPAGGQVRQIVKDVVTFNAQGKVKEKYNPYFVAASNSNYSAPGAEVGKATMEYDCVGRATRITNP
ncbi:MAG: SpvB/TcaC N-terminal domain-containing protein, partial [Candidatus Omnitrophota bacterium]